MKPDYELELLRERRLRPARRRDWAVNGYAAMEFQLGFFVLHSRSLFFSRFSFRSPISERPQVNEEHRDGVFVCAGCDAPLFSSAMKFDSGTGWPSFFTSIPGALKTSRDFKLILPRTEYHCARCGGHHGHVFNDGPEPTGQRYCNNGVALRFLPKEG